MRIKFEHTNDYLTRRTGLFLVNKFGKQISLASRINHAFESSRFEPREAGQRVR